LSSRPQIRGATQEDLEEIVRLNAEVFSEYQQRRKYFELAISYDPYYRPEFNRIAIVDGKIVSNVRIVHRRMRIGSSLVLMGGIADVSTLVPYRRRGLATALLKDALNYMREHGYVVSLLFTGIAPFYRRLGWEIVLHNISISGDVLSLAKRLEDFIGSRNIPKYEIRRFEENDLKSVARVYDEDNRSRTCTIERTLEYWRLRLKGSFELGFESPEGFLVALKDDSVVAYIRSKLNENTCSILEACSLRGFEGAYVYLLRRLLKLCIERRISSVRALLPEDHPMTWLLIELGAYLSKSRSGAMLKVVDLVSLFRALADELLARTKKSGLVSQKKTLAIETDIGVCSLRISESEIEVLEEKASSPDGVLKVDQRVLAQLITGFRDVRTAVGYGDAIVHPYEAIKLFDALFPPGNPYFWRFDSF